MHDSIGPEPKSLARGPLIAAIALFFAALCLHLDAVYTDLSAPLRDTHDFRQTQTALGAYWDRAGSDVFGALPVLGPPWSVPLELPLYQKLVSWFSEPTVESVTRTGRVVSILVFYLGLPALWIVLGCLGFQTIERWIFGAVLLCTPVYVFFTRTVLIESTAWTLALWYAAVAVLALRRRSIAFTLGALALGCPAGMVKSTTLAVHLPLILLAAWLHRHHATDRQYHQRRLASLAALLIIPPLIAAFAWTAWADAIKSAGPLTQSQTSGELLSWTFGATSDRWSLGWWHAILAQVERAVLPLSSLLIFVACVALQRGRYGRQIAVALGLSVLGPLVFANLYRIHDYYFYANGVFLLAALTAPLLAAWRSNEVQLAAKVVLTGLLLFSQFGGYRTIYHPLQTSPANRPPEVTIALKEITRPDDVLLGLGLHWSSVYPFYSERRAIMVPDPCLPEHDRVQAAVQSVGVEHIAALLIGRHSEAAQQSAAQWIAKLQLDPTPVLLTGEHAVYFKRERMTEAVATLRANPPPTAWIYGEDPTTITSLATTVYFADQVSDQSVFVSLSPRPQRVVAPYPLSLGELGDRRVFGAHAPTEVVFTAPDRPVDIRATYGLAPGAFDQTDGVTFQVVHRNVHGGESVLFERLLLPRELETDRGIQSLQLVTLQAIDGELIFKTTPGLYGNTNYDWAYWGEIQLIARETR